MVHLTGFKPAPLGLRARYSAIELQMHAYICRDSNPGHMAYKATALTA